MRMGPTVRGDEVQPLGCLSRVTHVRGHVTRQQRRSVSLRVHSRKYVISGIFPCRAGGQLVAPALPFLIPPRLFSPRARNIASRINVSLRMSNGAQAGPRLTSVAVALPPRTGSRPCCARPSTATQTCAPPCWTAAPTSTLPTTLAGTNSRAVRFSGGGGAAN